MLRRLRQLTPLELRELTRPTTMIDVSRAAAAVEAGEPGADDRLDEALLRAAG